MATLSLKQRIKNRWNHVFYSLLLTLNRQSTIYRRLTRFYCSTLLAFSRRMPLYPPPPDRPDRKGGRRLLYASPVGRDGKRYLSKIINRFGHEEFDYLIWVYDDTEFNEPVFSQCTFIREKGIICYFFKKYLTPEYCAPYDYIFTWVDDLDIDRFDYREFLDVMERNSLELAQPALSHHSLRSHMITVKHPYPVGRSTDFVEVMAMVLTNAAWNRYWKMLEPDWNFWGWGYNHLLRSVCGINRLGIVDSQSVTHLKLGSRFTSAPAEKKKLFQQYEGHERSQFKTEGELS